MLHTLVTAINDCHIASGEVRHLGVHLKTLGGERCVTDAIRIASLTQPISGTVWNQQHEGHKNGHQLIQFCCCTHHSCRCHTRSTVLGVLGRTEGPQVSIPHVVSRSLHVCTDAMPEQGLVGIKLQFKLFVRQIN